MEYLEKRAERFRRNGQLHGEEMEDIIAEQKEAEEMRGDGDAESNARATEQCKKQLPRVCCNHMASRPTQNKMGSSDYCAKTQTVLTIESRGTKNSGRPLILRMNWRRTGYYLVNIGSI
jgi:hypothetical protein